MAFIPDDTNGTIDRWDPHAPTAVSVLRRSDILAMGITDIEIYQQLRRGELTRLRHGIYADAHALAAANPAGLHVAHLRASLLGATKPAFANGPSAGLVLRMPTPGLAPDDLHIVREALQDSRSLREPSRHRLQIPPTVITTHRDIAAHTTVVDGIPVVLPPIAAITCGHLFSFSRRVGMLDSALWTGQVSAEELQELAYEWQHLGGLDANLAALAHARRGAQTYAETYSRLVLVRLGLPEPQLQVPFFDEDGLIGYADMYFPGLNVIGEVDGAFKYATHADVLAEKLREDRFRTKGLGVARWLPRRIREDPQAVVADIWRAGRMAA